MFPTNMTTHYDLHLVRQRELEAVAENYRLSTMIQRDNKLIAARKRVGLMLISLGQKLAQQPGKDIQLAFSAK